MSPSRPFISPTHERRSRRWIDRRGGDCARAASRRRRARRPPGERVPETRDRGSWSFACGVPVGGGRRGGSVPRTDGATVSNSFGAIAWTQEGISIASQQFQCVRRARDLLGCARRPGAALEPGSDRRHQQQIRDVRPPLRQMEKACALYVKEARERPAASRQGRAAPARRRRRRPRPAAGGAELITRTRAECWSGVVSSPVVSPRLRRSRRKQDPFHQHQRAGGRDLRAISPIWCSSSHPLAHGSSRAERDSPHRLEDGLTARSTTSFRSN